MLRSLISAALLNESMQSLTKVPYTELNQHIFLSLDAIITKIPDAQVLTQRQKIYIMSFEFLDWLSLSEDTADVDSQLTSSGSFGRGGVKTKT